MKFKWPKKITIGDTEYKIKYDGSTSGGEFYMYDEDNDNKVKGGGCIVIGTKLKAVSPTAILSVFIHEVKEIIQINQSVRYKRPDDSTAYEFHYSHREHTDLCQRLANALDQFIK